MGVSVLVGVIFIIIFYVTKNSVFQGKGKAIFKGYVNLLASFLIALLGFAMLRFMNYEAKWERKLREAHQESVEVHPQSHAPLASMLFLYMHDGSPVTQLAHAAEAQEDRPRHQLGHFPALLLGSVQGGH